MGKRFSSTSIGGKGKPHPRIPKSLKTTENFDRTDDVKGQQMCSDLSLPTFRSLQKLRHKDKRVRGSKPDRTRIGHLKNILRTSYQHPILCTTFEPLYCLLEKLQKIPVVEGTDCIASSRVETPKVCTVCNITHTTAKYAADRDSPELGDVMRSSALRSQERGLGSTASHRDASYDDGDDGPKERRKNDCNEEHNYQKMNEDYRIAQSDEKMSKDFAPTIINRTLAQEAQRPLPLSLAFAA